MAAQKAPFRIAHKGHVSPALIARYICLLLVLVVIVNDLIVGVVVLLTAAGRRRRLLTAHVGAGGCRPEAPACWYSFSLIS